MFIKPQDNKTVRDPLTGDPLPTAGANKPETMYWLRRLRDGDVVRCKPRKSAKPSKETK